MKWKYDYVFFEKKQKEKMTTKYDRVLESLCEKIPDSVHDIFTRKYYLVRISQSKNGQIYLIIRKKTGRLRKTVFTLKD